MKKINYITKTNVTLDEFQKAFKIIPKNYWSSVMWSMLFLTIFFAIWAVIEHTDFVFLIIIEIILFVIMLVTHRFTMDDKARKYYKKLCENGNRDNEYVLKFYNDKLEKESVHLAEKIEYQNIKKIIETDTNFYLQLDTRVIVVEKCNCETELISFVREISSKKYVNKRDGKKVNKNKKVIKILLDILFTITFLTIFFAMNSVSVVDEYLKTPIGATGHLNMWVLWLWLPIPVLSLVLGLRYHRREFDCSKNIVVGVFVFAILLIFGSTWLFEKELSYDNVNKYSDILSVTLPDDGTYTSSKYDNYRNSKTIANVRFSQVYFSGDENNFDVFEKEIMNSENWIIGAELDNSLEIFLDSQNEINRNTYYLIYNVSTSNYNTIPNEKGVYHIYLAEYYKNLKTLNILEFDYIK